MTSFWKDGRDVPDVMTAILSYPDSPEHPAFQVALRVNFVSGQGDTSFTRFIGSEGVLEMTGDGFTIHHHKMSEAPGIGGWDALNTYPQAMQDELVRQYNARWTPAQRQPTTQPPTVYQLPNDYNEDLEHHMHFYDAVRNGAPVVEDPTFGFRAAAPCLLANESYYSNSIVHWDPIGMRVIT